MRSEDSNKVAQNNMIAHIKSNLLKELDGCDPQKMKMF